MTMADGYGVITAFIYLMIMIQVPFCNDIFFFVHSFVSTLYQFFFSIITINVCRMMTIIILANDHNGSYFWLEIKPINCFSYGFFFIFNIWFLCTYDVMNMKKKFWFNYNVQKREEVQKKLWIIHCFQMILFFRLVFIFYFLANQYIQVCYCCGDINERHEWWWSWTRWWLELLHDNLVTFWLQNNRKKIIHSVINIQKVSVSLKCFFE